MSNHLTDEDREALADSCDAGYDFGAAWIRFIRNGNEDMLLPAVERIVARHRAEALEEAARVLNERADLADADPNWTSALYTDGVTDGLVSAALIVRDLKRGVTP